MGIGLITRPNARHEYSPSRGIGLFISPYSLRGDTASWDTSFDTSAPFYQSCWFKDNRLLTTFHSIEPEIVVSSRHPYSVPL